ncbi:septum site-determining protein Ssd [Arthrobacter sp. LAPM80]|uniref:septum site-determining protein Ssd n=1 Tax=Arthrobacter sp. LAPM80 TaxID=3141788 RepID=UPI00398A835C
MRKSHGLPLGTVPEPWLPRRDTTVLLLSASAELQGAVGRVSAAADVELVVGEGLEQAAGRWGDLAAVLIDAALDAEVAVDAALAGWRGPTAVVGFSADSAQVWQQAERMGADRVAILPESAPWLANYLSCLRKPASGAGVVGILGGCGGAGASTLAVLVAAGAARQGVRTLLVDGDPWGGGLCTALSAQDVPGLRWPELLRASGAINPEQLAAALPHIEGLALLSWDTARQQPTRPFGTASFGSLPSPQPASPAHSQQRAGTAVGEVMRAARGAYGLVVVDVGRTPDAVNGLAPHCNGVAVVLPGKARAAAATLQMRLALPPKPVAAVVSGPLGEGLDAPMVAAAVGMPMVGRLPRMRGLAEAMESRRLPELLGRRPVQALVANILDWMAGDDPNTGRRPNDGMAAAGTLP